MLSNDVAIQARGVSKSYRITHEQRATTIGESFIKKLKSPLSKTEVETFWAVKDVDFDIKQGDVVGIIGRNGAGKSTLLKILSRITAPTLGEIKIRGRVGSLLEVGTGFHPELTGRENIFLNGAILGMSRKEIETRFDQIVDFSGVEKFLDTPVKRYSSGMYVRLAFSVAAHLDPEVMIVDEVLAVGDSEFQKKCLSRMQAAASDGRTVIFVSHNMQTVSQLCKTTIFLQSGQIRHIGPTEETINQYVAMQSEALTEVNPDTRRGTGDYRIFSPYLPKTTIQSGDPLHVQFRVEHKKGHAPFFNVTYHICDEHGSIVIHGDSRLNQFGLHHKPVQWVDIDIAGVNLKPGTYRIDLMLHIEGFIDVYEYAGRFDVSPVLPTRLAVSDFGYQYGQVIAETNWQASESDPSQNQEIS